MKKPTTSNRFSQKLKQYASLGAAFLITAPMANANVIYTDVDPDETYNLGDIAIIDIDNNGVKDFSIEVDTYGVRAFRNAGASNNSVIVANTSYYLPQVLNYGDPITPSQNFMTYSSVLDVAYSASYSLGNWKGDVTGYLGVRFRAGSIVHYGYIHIRVVNSSQFILLDYAYDCSPNAGMTAGATTGGNTCLLSAELTDLKASAKEDHIMLNWKTETEIENAGFHLQRATANLEWEDIAWIEGQGTHVGTQDYDYADRSVQQGVTYYYRLKQIDFEGIAVISDIVSAVIYNDRFSMSPLMPNPVSQGANTFIEIKNPTVGQARITILDAAGRLQAEQSTTLQSYSTRLTINTVGLASGTYFVKVATNTQAEYRKLVIH